MSAKTTQHGRGKRAREGLIADFARWGWDARGWSANTRSGYVYALRRAERWLADNGRPPLADAFHRDLQALLFAAPAHPRYRNQIRQTLVAFYDYLVDQRVRPDNPAAGLPRLKEPRSLPKALDRDQAERVLHAARAHGPMWHAYVALLMFAGLRREEARTLTWSDVEPGGGWLRITEKGSDERDLPLHPEVRDALTRWRTESTSAQWVFASPVDPTSPVGTSTIQRHICAIGESAGLDQLHPHVLRHTYGTRLVEQGTDIRTVQEALGHQALSSTQVYLRARPARVEEAVNGLDFAQRPAAHDDAQ